MHIQIHKSLFRPFRFPVAQPLLAHKATLEDCVVAKERGLGVLPLAFVKASCGWSLRNCIVILYLYNVYV